MNKEDEARAKAETKEILDHAFMDEKQDSYSLGTPGKGGAVKVYFDLASMTDEEVQKLCNRAKGLAIAMGVKIE